MRSTGLQDQTPTLLVLTGPPASGKTTVGRALAEQARQPSVHLPADHLHAWIRTGFIPPYLPEGARQNEVVTDAVLAAAGAYLRGG